MTSLSTRIAATVLASALLTPFSPFSTVVRLAREAFFRPAVRETGTVTVTEEEAKEQYNADCDVLKEYLPGIVCWGDSLIMGAGGDGTTVESVLGDLIKENILSHYDLKAKMNASDESDVSWTSYSKLRVTVVNMGVGGENAATVLGRAGATPIHIGELTVPAGAEETDITFLDENGQKIELLHIGDVGVNPVRIGDIRGRISVYGKDDGTLGYRFRRTTAGEETVLFEGSVLETAATERYRDFVSVLMLGGNGGFGSYGELVKQHRTLLGRQERNGDRYLILGYPCVSAMRPFDDYPDVNRVLADEFGDHFIDLNAYFASLAAFDDAGLTPTKDDLDAIERGDCPKTFLADDLHLNAIGYRLTAQLVYDRMDALGYFNEIKDVCNVK